MLSDFSVENEPLPEGYNGAIKNCEVLSANLLSLAVKRCCDCSEWVGRCRRGYVFRIAIDEVCSSFSKNRKGE
jgi:hypothetical protein